MGHSAPRAVLILGLICGACGVQHQKVHQGTVAPPEPLGDAVMPAVSAGLVWGAGLGGLRQLWLGYQHCLTTEIYQRKIDECNTKLDKCSNKTGLDARSAELCKADIWNNGASGCAGAWEVERGWRNKPFSKNCVGPYEITKRAVATAIWSGIGGVPGFLVGTIQYFAAGLEACKKAFDLEDRSKNNTDFDYNDFVGSDWWVQRLLHEEPEGSWSRCRRMNWRNNPFKQVRERVLEYKEMQMVKIPDKPGETEWKEVDVDKTKYRRCLNYPDPSKGGIMEYGGCWEDGQTTDYFVPYYNKSTGLTIIFQGQPSIMNKDGKCLYATTRKNQNAKNNQTVGNTFGRGHAFDGDPKYRRFERSFWILSKAKTVSTAYMTEILDKIENEYNVDISRLQTVDNSGADCGS